MYSRVPECQVTTYYYVGFAYLMMRRYQDAIRVFANILLYIQRTKSMFQRATYKYEMVRGRAVSALTPAALPLWLCFSAPQTRTLVSLMHAARPGPHTGTPQSGWRGSPALLPPLCLQ